MEIICIPTVTGGAIQEFASEVTSKAFFHRFDEELQLSLICDQYCFFFERNLRIFFFFPFLFFFPFRCYSLRFFLSSLFFEHSPLLYSLSLLFLPLLIFFFLQHCLQSLLQSDELFLEVPVLLMGSLDLLIGLLDLPGSNLEQIFLGLLMRLEGMFEGFHVVVDFLCELIQVALLRLLGFHQPMSMMRN